MTETIFTPETSIWKPGFSVLVVLGLQGIVVNVQPPIIVLQSIDPYQETRPYHANHEAIALAASQPQNQE